MTPHRTFLTALTALLFALTACTQDGFTAINKQLGVDGDSPLLAVCVLDPFLSTCGEEFADARQDFIIFCTTKDNATSELCATAIKHLCTDDPFNPACGADFQDRRDLLIETCTIGAGTNPNCPNLLAHYPCITNPYQQECRDIYASARTRRADFCALGGNNANAYCTDITTDICARDPFAPICDYHFDTARRDRTVFCQTDGNAAADICASAIIRDPCVAEPFAPLCGDKYADARDNRAEFCALGGNASDAICTGVIVRDACVLNPFASGCNNTPARASRMAFCGVKDNASHTLCADTVLTRPTTASLLQGFDKTPPALASPDHLQSQFLQGTADGLNLGDVRKQGHAKARIYTLNLKNGDGTRDFNGDATNGVAFGGLSHADSDRFTYYAGIFADTDLGDPLPLPVQNAATTAEWDGVFSARGYYAYHATAVDFTLYLDLANRTARAFVPTDYTAQHPDFATYYQVQGSYDALGVMDGTVIAGKFADGDKTATPTGVKTGRLHGLIGQHGAIGAFISNPNIRYGFGGGFIALNPDTQD